MPYSMELTKPERRELMNGKFSFKSDSIVVCKHCKAEFKYRKSNSSLSYHLRTKHAFAVATSNVSSTGPSTSRALGDKLAHIDHYI